MSATYRLLSDSANSKINYSLYSWTQKSGLSHSLIRNPYENHFASTLSSLYDPTLQDAVFKPFYPAPTEEDYAEVINSHLHVEKIDAFLKSLHNPNKSLRDLQRDFLDLQTSDPVIFEEICKQVYNAYKDKEKTGPDFAKNKVLNNPLILLQLKNRENKNILEQIREFYYTLELRKSDENLLSSLRNKLSNILECDVDAARIEINKIDVQRVLSLLSYRIWELDNPTKDVNFSGWGYGEKLIQNNPFYLLNFKNVNLINEYLESAKKLPNPQISITNIPNNPPLPTDNIYVVKNINYGMQIEELKGILDSSLPKQEIYNKISSFDNELKTAIMHFVWVGHYMPTDSVTFGEDILKHNPFILRKMRDSEGRDLIEQLQMHFKTKVELERRLIKLKTFSEIITSPSESKQRKLKAFNDLDDQVLKDSLGYQIWYRHGGFSDPKFKWGAGDYGKEEILRDPNVLLNKGSTEKNALETVLIELEKIARKELPEIQKIIEKQFSVPTAVCEDITINRLNTSDTSMVDQIKKVTLVTAEFEGICKVGGLAPAIYGMAEALTLKGQKIKVIMPKYDTLPKNIQEKLVLKTHYKDKGMKKELSLNDRYGKGKIDKVYKLKLKGRAAEFKDIFKGFKGNTDNITFYFIEDTPETSTPTAPNRFSGGAYSGNDDAVKERFGYFSSAAAQLASTLTTDVVHSHDWHTAAVPKLIRMKGKDIPLVFTFHNNLDQGVYWSEKQLQVLDNMGLGKSARNLMVEAFYNAHQITTVSRTFAKEAQGKLLGRGIDPELRKVAYQGRLTGIVNGSNPSLHDTSSHEQLANWVHPLSVNGQWKIPLTFCPSDDIFKKKMEIAEQLQLYFLKNHNVCFDFQKPLVLFVGRYDLEQKGLEMLEHAMDTALANGAQVVFMGLESDRKDDPAKAVLDRLEKKAREYGNGAFVARTMDFQKKIGNLLRAVAALTLVPSKFEPCGLVQLEGMLYASAPFCRKTGGLPDTVKHGETGFLYEAVDDPNSPEQIAIFKRELAKAIEAMKELYADPEKANQFFKKLQKVGKASEWVTAPEGMAPIDQYRYVYGQAKKDTKKSDVIAFEPPFLKKAPQLIKA